ncbi:MAG: hypothetical protein A3F67_07010 [Verrucomicrobia bacterium RIFCSPHIGHO2_12_FULL_41_10]|nr:MAG: hypothetical protein A3F67_07010 [Verrucomicrobia bacterium RIFCSPHIGHO2_12_FULL_41_10]
MKNIAIVCIILMNSCCLLAQESSDFNESQKNSNICGYGENSNNNQVEGYRLQGKNRLKAIGYRLEEIESQIKGNRKSALPSENQIGQRVESTTNCELPTTNCNNSSENLNCYLMMNPAEEDTLEELIDGETRPIFRSNHFGGVKEEGILVTSSSSPALITSVTASSDQGKTISSVITSVDYQAAFHEAGTVLNLTEDARKLFCAFQEETKLAKAAAEAAENSNTKIDHDFEEWLNNSIEQTYFQIAKVHASKDRIDEILKVANVNVVKCNDGKKRIFLDPEKFVDLDCKFDFKKAIETVNTIDSFLDNAITDSGEGSIEEKDVIENKKLVKKVWEHIAKVARAWSSYFIDQNSSLQSEILKMEHTIQYYNTDKEQLLCELSIHHSNAASAYNKVTNRAIDILNQMSEIKDNTLSFSKISFDDACSKMLEAKKSFDAVDLDARNCLNIDNINFQDEDDKRESDLLANNFLYNAFKEKKVKCIKKLKIAKISEGKLAAQLEKLRDNYVSLNGRFSDAFDSLKVKDSFEMSKLFLDEAKDCAKETQRAWDDTTNATIEAKDFKIAWAKNILRLAERGAGNFDLGEATKREGEILAVLWLGDGASRVKLEDNKEILMSYDGLKRVRLLSYKPKEGKYMMNFEGRAGASSAWDFNTPTLSNGHLTIINPHDDDANESFISLKFEKLTPLQLNEAYTEKEAEMQMQAGVLFDHIQKELARRQNIVMQARAADYDRSVMEADAFNSEANIIKQNLQEKIIPQAIEAYKKGFNMAPENRRDWWMNQIDVLKMESQMIDAIENNTENEEVWHEAIQSFKSHHLYFKKEIEQCQKAYDLIPKSNKKLRGYWRKEVDCFNCIKNKQIAMEYYYQARRATDPVMKAGFNAMSGFVTYNNQEWDEIAQNIRNVVPLWDKVIEEYNNSLMKATKGESLSNIKCKHALKVAYDAKNRCIASECIVNAGKAFLVTTEACQRAVQAPATEQEDLWNVAIQKNKEEKIAIDRAMDKIQQGLSEVSESRKDLCAWWKKSLLGIQDNKNKCIASSFMCEASRASVIANLARHQAITIGALPETVEVWSDTVQKSEKAKIAWQKALEELRKGMNNVTFFKQEWAEHFQLAQDEILQFREMRDKMQVDWNQRLKFGEDACSSWSATILQLKETSVHDKI